MYVLWRPTDLSIPFPASRRLGYGGHPRDTMSNCLPAEAEIYIVPDAESVWSYWLQTPLVSQPYEPWLVAKIEACREEQRQLEGNPATPSAMAPRKPTLRGSWGSNKEPAQR